MRVDVYHEWNRTAIQILQVCLNGGKKHFFLKIHLKQNSTILNYFFFHSSILFSSLIFTFYTENRLFPFFAIFKASFIKIKINWQPYFAYISMRSSKNSLPNLTFEKKFDRYEIAWHFKTTNLQMEHSKYGWYQAFFRNQINYIIAHILEFFYPRITQHQMSFPIFAD